MKTTLKTIDRRLVFSKPIPLVLGLFFAAFAFNLGCNVPTVDGVNISGPRNKCAVGCPNSTTCVDDMCLSSTTEYDYTIEVKPAAGSIVSPELVVPISPMKSRAGGTRDLVVPRPSSLSVRLEAGSRSQPLFVRLDRLDDVPNNLDGATYIGQAQTGTPPRVRLSVPPGEYRVLAIPLAELSTGPLPPITQTAPLFESGSEELVLSVAGDGPRFVLTLQDIAGKPFAEGRQISIIDPATGAPLSSVARTCDGSAVVSLALGNAPIDKNAILRVAPPTPPCDAKIPPNVTFDFDLQALDVEGTRRATVSLPAETLSATVFGEVRAFGTNAALRSNLVFRSREIKFAQPVRAGRAYSTTRTFSDADSGRFFVSLPPGTFTVEVLPDTTDVKAREYAVCVDCAPLGSDGKPADAVIEVTPTGVSSKLRVPVHFDVRPRVRVIGSAVGFDQGLFSLGALTVNVSSTLETRNLAGTLLRPRSLTTPVSVAYDKAAPNILWNLEAAVDPGGYDLTVRLPPASGYPWIVRPNVDIRIDTPRVELGVLPATAPVRLRGVVVDPTGIVIPNALVRARARLPSLDCKSTASTLVVGEAISGIDGRYVLLLPSRIDGLPTCESP